MSVSAAPRPRPVRTHAFSPGAEQELIALLTAASCGLLLVFPMASFALSAFLLINLPDYTPRAARIALAAVLGMSLAMMTGARPLDPANSNDIDGYYVIYQELAAGDLSFLGHFGAGLEFALPALMLLFVALLPELSVNGLMFALALTSALMAMVWVEVTFYSNSKARRPALLGVCLLMLNLYFSTQLVRQYLALLMLLYAFTAHGRGKQALFVLLATSFHLTALPFVGIYLLARRGWPGWLAIIAIALFLRLYFTQLLVAFDVLPQAVADKLLYYVDNTEEALATDLGSLRMIFLIAVVSLLVVMEKRGRPAPAVRPWLAVPWLAGAVHLVLLPIPLASLRATLIVHSIAPGLIICRMLATSGHRLAMAVFNVLFAYKVAAFLTAPDSGNLLSTASMVGAFLL
jgi:hypothetical protein